MSDKPPLRRAIKDIHITKDSENLLDSDIDIYAKEVLSALIKDALPPTPNNFTLYFDRLLDDKSQNSKKAILAVLEQEENNEDERILLFEQNLKKGFSSIKNLMNLVVSLYKNVAVLTNILEKKRLELRENTKDAQAIRILDSLDSDVQKVSAIFKSQTSNIKDIYDETANIIKIADNETIFDNQFGVYNKRFLMSKVSKEIESVEKFKHKSSLIMVELSKKLKDSIKNDKAHLLMTKTIARLLLKTSRRSDMVAHFGNGVFVMLLKYTDIESAKKASERLSDLVSNSTFFLGDTEVQLKIAIGITDIDDSSSTEEILVSAMEAIENVYKDENGPDFAVVTRKLSESL